MLLRKGQEDLTNPRMTGFTEKQSCGDQWQNQQPGSFKQKIALRGVNWG